MTKSRSPRREPKVEALEAVLYQRVSTVIDRARLARGFSYRQMAEAMDTSIPVVQRLLKRTWYGPESPTLRTLARASLALGIEFVITSRPIRPNTEGKNG